MNLMEEHSSKRHAIVIGGSLAGLFTGILLQSIGWHVDIYERSLHDLSGRGGGIVLQPEIIEAFQRVGIAYEVPLGECLYFCVSRCWFSRENGLGIE